VGVVGIDGKPLGSIGGFVLRSARMITPWRSTICVGRPITIIFTVDAAPGCAVSSAMIGSASSHTNGGNGEDQANVARNVLWLVACGLAFYP
jgi:hypothetical protein